MTSWVFSQSFHTLCAYFHIHAKHAGNMKSSAQFQRSHFNTTKICRTLKRSNVERIEMKLYCFFNSLYCSKWTSSKPLWASVPYLSSVPDSDHFQKYTFLHILIYMHVHTDLEQNTGL